MPSEAREIIKERRETVTRLYWVSGYTQQEIAKAIDADPRTVWNDVQAVRAEMMKVAQSSGNETVVRILKRKEYMAQEIIRNYSKSESEKHRQGWIRELRELDKDFAALVMDLGLVYKAPQKMDVEMRSVQLIASLIEEVKKTEEPKEIESPVIIPVSISSIKSDDLVEKRST